MAATVSPWGKPGAWALDAEEHEAQLEQEKEKNGGSDKPLADFPSLAAAAATKSKKKKAQTISLAEFTTYSGPKPVEPKGLTHEDLMQLPTGPRERSAEELDRSRLGGGFKSYGSRYGSNGDDSSNSRRGGFNRDAGRESAPSRADEIDDWGAAKKSMAGNGFGNGFERRERGGLGFSDSQSSRADESDSWVSNKSSAPSEGRRFGASERRGSFDSLSRGGADSENWGRRREESSNGSGGGMRPRLNLQPRTLPVSNGKEEAAGTVVKPKGANPFGEARPREDVLAEKGKDWKEIEEKFESVKIKELATETSGRKSFGIGNGRASLGEDRTERCWRKSDSEDANSHSSAEEKAENGTVEEN